MLHNKICTADPCCQLKNYAHISSYLNITWESIITNSPLIWEFSLCVNFWFLLLPTGFFIAFVTKDDHIWSVLDYPTLWSTKLLPPMIIYSTYKIFSCINFEYIFGNLHHKTALWYKSFTMCWFMIVVDTGIMFSLLFVNMLILI